MNKRQSCGFILVTVLIFILIFSPMSSYGLTRSIHAVKNNGHEWEAYGYRLKSHKTLQKIESGIVLDQAACIISVTPAPILAQKPRSWWQLHACSVNVDGIHYYYAIESMDDDPCAAMGKLTRNQLVTAHYYRITLYVVPDRLKGAKFILQSTLALAGISSAACQGVLHNVSPGRQMWREL